MSSGISNNPIIPRIKKAAIKLGTIPISEIIKFLKSLKNNSLYLSWMYLNICFISMD